MKIHEYQAKELLASYGIPIAGGRVIDKAADAIAIAREVSKGPWVVKAQIHAGGRGKGGGVKLVQTLDEVKSEAKRMLGMNLVTAQTGPEGKKVHKVYIESASKIVKELYLAILLDRQLEMPVLIASTEGGMEIEKIAEETPKKILKVAIDPAIGMADFYIRQIAYGLDLTEIETKNFHVVLRNIYRLYMEKNAELIEINPLVSTDREKIIALDAKMSFDDNALFFHPDIQSMRDITEENPAEFEAKENDLNYVKLDGNVGCMVNGAGLAMATMDIIKFEGGEPANFLDVGGGASPESVAKAFEIILKDSNVKAIFVNIFGGIVRCDRVANGIIEAAKITNVEVPIVVRLDGTNAEEASEILKSSSIKNIIAAEDLADGARKVVKAARGEF